MGAQETAIRGAALSLTEQRGTTVVGEMGVGKTFIAIAAAQLAGFQRVLVLCPPHLVGKWQREIEETIPLVRTGIADSITDLEQLRRQEGSGPQYVVMSHSRAKLGHRFRPAYWTRRLKDEDGNPVRDEETGEFVMTPACPDCTAQIVDAEGVPVTHQQLDRKRHNCPRCGTPLWTAEARPVETETAGYNAGLVARRTPGQGPRKVPLADYVKNHMRGYFDLLIVDEVHEHKGRGSAQGLSAGILADACGKSLALSGTLMGGYASTLFHLLYRFSPEIRSEFGRSDERKWIERYGFLEQRVRHDRDDDPTEDGSQSRRSYRKQEKERPGMAPAALFHLIGHSCSCGSVRCGFGAAALRGADPGGQHGHRGGHPRAVAGLGLPHPRDRPQAGAAQGDRARFGPAALDLPAGAAGLSRGLHPGRVRVRPGHGRPDRPAAAARPERVYPKEQQLIDLVAAGTVGRTAGAGLRDPHRHARHHRAAGDPAHPARLPRRGDEGRQGRAQAARGLGPEAGRGGIDVLICHPRLVQTGLDLIQFPTVCWYETDYSVYTMRQASRRSWRIGQHRPVKVVFMAYRNTLQADALKLVAQKLQSSLAVEGDLPEDGLAAYGDTGDDLMMALARKLVSGETDDEGVEDVFRQAQQVAAEAEDLLVDADWERVTAEPLVLPPPLDGHAQPVVELVPCGSHHGQDELQQTLFSWAEFLADEPEPTPGRGRKPQPSGPSLFDWALEREQQGELAAAGG